MKASALCPISTNTKVRRSNSAASSRPPPDPDVVQQFGMTVGKPDAGQVMRGDLDVRGERFVTCRGDFDRHPSLGPLPKGAPPGCDIFVIYPTRSSVQPS